MVLLGGMEAVEEEDKPPEQPIVERDPTGRWSRVGPCMQRSLFNFTCLCVRWNKVGRPSLQVDQILGRGAFKDCVQGL